MAPPRRVPPPPATPRPGPRAAQAKPARPVHAPPPLAPLHRLPGAAAPPAQAKPRPPHPPMPPAPRIKSGALQRAAKSADDDDWSEIRYVSAAAGPVSVSAGTSSGRATSAATSSNTATSSPATVGGATSAGTASTAVVAVAPSMPPAGAIDAAPPSAATVLSRWVGVNRYFISDRPVMTYGLENCIAVAAYDGIWVAFAHYNTANMISGARIRSSTMSHHKAYAQQQLQALKDMLTTQLRQVSTAPAHAAAHYYVRLGALWQRERDDQSELYQIFAHAYHAVFDDDLDTLPIGGAAGFSPRTGRFYGLDTRELPAASQAAEIGQLIS